MQRNCTLDKLHSHDLLKPSALSCRKHGRWPPSPPLSPFPFYGQFQCMASLHNRHLVAPFSPPLPPLSLFLIHSPPECVISGARYSYSPRDGGGNKRSGVFSLGAAASATGCQYERPRISACVALQIHRSLIPGGLRAVLAWLGWGGGVEPSSSLLLLLSTLLLLLSSSSSPSLLLLLFSPSSPSSSLLLPSPSLFCCCRRRCCVSCLCYCLLLLLLLLLTRILW